MSERLLRSALAGADAIGQTDGTHGASRDHEPSMIGAVSGEDPT